MNPIKLRSPDEFQDLLCALWGEWFWANWYYDIHKEALRLCAENEEAFQMAPHFWDSTLRAHHQTALVYLHRIYDQNRQSFNVHRFLLTVKTNPGFFEANAVRGRLLGNPHVDSLLGAIGPLDPVQLDRDIKFSSLANPTIAKLKEWRDRVSFHKDETVVLKQKPLEHNHPLSPAEIEQLLNGGYEILNRYSQYFNTHRYTGGFKEWKDIKIVFEALMRHPDVVRRRSEREEEARVARDEQMQN
jgi:hypothetical protein